MDKPAELCYTFLAGMAELADALDSGSSGSRTWTWEGLPR